MDAVKYFNEKTRMLDSLGRTGEGCHGVDSVNCPLSTDNNGMKIVCTELECTHPEKAIEIVEKWSAEHPIKTMLMDFMEKHQNAQLNDNGAPYVCPYVLGYEDKRPDICKTLMCSECWSRPIKKGDEQG